jgi:zinc/manganese transport system substrate-binding protein
MTNTRSWVAALFAILAAMTTASAQSERPKIVATFSVLGDMIKNVAGENVSLTVLVGPDNDVHLYEPTVADAKSVADAALVVSNGLGLEEWLPKLLANAGFRGKVVAATAGLRTLTMEAEDHGGQHEPVIDPHAWQDARNGRVYVANIEKALAQADPARADTYRGAADAYVEALGDLDRRIRSELAAIPRTKRRVITTHDAFQYYGKAYGIQFLAAVGITTESEPSAGALAQLVQQIKREQIKALFLENVTSGRVMERLAKEAGVELGPRLYSDALSAANGPASTYVKMLEYNTAILKAAMLKN